MFVYYVCYFVIMCVFSAISHAYAHEMRLFASDMSTRILHISHAYAHEMRCKVTTFFSNMQEKT